MFPNASRVIASVAAAVEAEVEKVEAFFEGDKSDAPEVDTHVAETFGELKTEAVPEVAPEVVAQPEVSA